VLDELVPNALHVTEQYANNPVEADHGRLKARLRPMRGLKRFRSAAVIAAGHAFIQNLRRGHYELGTAIPTPLRVATAFTELEPGLPPVPPAELNRWSGRRLRRLGRHVLATRCH
jgi:transposase, IS6 family